MSTTPKTSPEGSFSSYRGPLLRRCLQVLFEAALFGVVLLVSAGDLRWGNAWLFVGLFLVQVIASAIYVIPRNPEIVVERGRLHEGTQGFDRVLMPFYMVTDLGVLVVAGLDGGRFGWARLGWPWVAVGVLLMVLGAVPVVWAMGVNRHLEKTVRIQSERGHQVVTGGPYRFVRHPMYLGAIIQMIGTALLLSSAWALLPAVACGVVLVSRTALEDRFLRRSLPGYADFAATTPYRLVPGVW
ncbi:MAG: hypothetical protein QG622_3244 [Actinomycetota bacterium]|nr:hypothetical protein [Actinomycetota bacterium]